MGFFFDRGIHSKWLKNLRPSEDFDRLADAARCRSEADWLVGMNATRAMTCLVRNAGGDQLLTIGRVQTPTLALIVERDRQIANFEPQPFWRIEAKFEAKILKQHQKILQSKNQINMNQIQKSNNTFIGKFFRGPIFAVKNQKIFKQ